MSGGAGADTTVGEGRGGAAQSVTAGAGVAAGVGSGIERPERFRPVAAWAWMWRSFDVELPDVTGAAWRAEPGTEAVPARAAEAAAYARYTAHGPW
ncbi:hypothetical protein ACF1CG_37015 [Streptomyces sp. NPDC014773]|uniref:hypothetical protein n=1 Tax=Streptomyces sp. NPDC014773 TaxID=3364908 RepID=UPI0036F5C99A